VKERLKALVSERNRRRLRMLGRVRWLTKARVLGHNGVTLRSDPGRWLRYVLVDPEIDSFTYVVVNDDELAATLADVCGLDAAALSARCVEARSDPALREGLRRHVRWRLQYKRRLALGSHHLATWALIRELTPAAVVETGILEGLNSRVMLRALQRNEEDGRRGGRLLSFDLMPGAGALVGDELRARWTTVWGPTEETLEPALTGERVGLFVHDSNPEDAHQRVEYAIALRNAAPGLVLMTVDDWGPALREVAAEQGARYAHFQERPRDHFYQGNRIGFARLPE
jgi:hypothetical protein